MLDHLSAAILAQGSSHTFAINFEMDRALVVYQNSWITRLLPTPAAFYGYYICGALIGLAGLVLPANRRQRRTETRTLTLPSGAVVSFPSYQISSRYGGTQ